MNFSVFIIKHLFAPDHCLLKSEHLFFGTVFLLSLSSERGFPKQIDLFCMTIKLADVAEKSSSLYNKNCIVHHLFLRNP